MKNCRYVVVTDTTGDFPSFDKKGTFDEWVEREFKMMGIEESGSGYGGGGRDITGVAPSDEVAKAAKEYFNLFHKVKCTLWEFDDPDEECTCTCSCGCCKNDSDEED